MRLASRDDAGRRRVVSTLGGRSRAVSALCGATLRRQLRGHPVRRLRGRPGVGPRPQVHRRTAAGADGGARPDLNGPAPVRVPRTHDTRPAAPPHPVRRRRRVRLQGAAGRARAGAGRPAGRPRRCRPARRARERRRRGRGPDRRRPGGGGHGGLLHARSSTTSTTGAGSPPPTRSPTSTRWAASRWSPSTCWPGRATTCRSTWPPRCCAAAPTSASEAGVPPRRRAQHRRPRAEVRPGRHRPRRTRSGCCATTPARAGTPLTLTKPLGLGILNNRHKSTGEVFHGGGA